MTALRVLTLARYGALGASSRLRLFQYLPALRAAGLQVQVHSLFNDDVLLVKYQQGQYRFIELLAIYAQRFKALWQRKDFDLVWIEKEALPWLPLWLEAGLLRGVPYVLDFDDAVFHNYDLHRFAPIRLFLGKRLDGLMAKAALVVAGNEYLAGRARDAGAPWVEVLPTVIDLDRYPTPVYSDGVLPAEPLCVVWIGSPSTVRYLELIAKPLQSLAKRLPLVFRIIGAEFQIPGIRVECVRWAEAAEVESISDAHVGVMPLLNSPWEQGKCGYKLVQYMACGLPVVASPVGVNSQIVEHGVNGFLASTPQEWEQALRTLAADPALRAAMGQAGRRKVEQQYSFQVTGPKLVELLQSVVDSNKK